MSKKDKVIAAGLAGTVVLVLLPQAVNLYDLLRDKLSASRIHPRPDGNSPKWEGSA